MSNVFKQNANKENCPPGYAKGGRIRGIMPAIKGQPMNPLTRAKRNNGIPGYKAGGKIKSSCGM